MVFQVISYDIHKITFTARRIIAVDFAHIVDKNLRLSCRNIAKLKKYLPCKHHFNKEYIKNLHPIQVVNATQLMYWSTWRPVGQMYFR